MTETPTAWWGDEDSSLIMPDAGTYASSSHGGVASEPTPARASRQARRPRIRLDLVLLVLLAVLAIAPFGRLFASNLYLLESGLGALIALVCCRWTSPRRSLAVAVLVTIVAFALWSVFVVFHVAIPTLTDLSDVWSGVRNSWASVLSSPTPLASDGGLLVLPVALTWIGTFVGVELATRTKVAFATVVPALALFALALSFAGGRPVGSVVIPAVFLLGCLVTSLVRTRTTRSAGGGLAAESVASDDGPSRRSLELRLGLPVVIVVTVLGLLVGGVVRLTQDEERTDLRTGYRPPIDVRDAVSPLAAVRPGLHDEKNTAMFSVTFAGIGEGTTIDRIRVATLDDYDGAVWATGAEFAAVGLEVPPPALAPESTVAITQTYVLGPGYRSSFLPSLDRPNRIAGERLGFDPSTGMVVFDGEPSAGIRYEVTSAVPRYRDDELQRAPATVEPGLEDLSKLPADVALPPALLQYANDGRFAMSSPYAALTAIQQDMVSQTFGYNIDATPGHSLAAIGKFLGAGGEASASGRVGYSEQFAAAFAAVARARGLASRVVVGYLVDPAVAASGDRINVTSTQIHAWAEVNLAGVGWVAFDPTNRTEREPEPPPEIVTEPPETTAATTPLNESATTIDTKTGCAADPSKCARTSDTGSAWWAVVVLGILLLPPVGVVVAKRVRRSRRRSRGSPADRVLGAWREARDRLRGHGVATAGSMTVSELSASCAESAGETTAARLGSLAPMVDVALYAEDDPPEELIDAAWDAEATVGDALREHTSIVKRARVALDPRTLVGRR